MDGEGKLTRRESFAAVAGIATGLQGLRGDTPLDRIVASAGKGGWAAAPIGARVAAVGKALIDTPYVGGTLDRTPGKEVCVPLWDGLDCVTLVETSIAVARAFRTGRSVSESVGPELERIRYRGGKLDGYVSRLHYSTDWLLDNASRGIFQLLGEGWTGAERWKKQITFMSGHASSYAVLVARPELVHAIRATERALSERELPFVPRAALPGLESKFQTGDVVGFGTDVAGLDCSHVGLVTVESGRPWVLHASSTKKRVVLDRPLVDYVKAGKATGVFVARPREGR